MKKTLKLQSAMEYLMTYGWAILIIAVVLGALFSIGVFKAGSFTTTSCIAGPGYFCSNPVFDHTSGNIIVQIGQSTGTDWTAVNAIFVPSQFESTVTASSNLGSGGTGGFGAAYSANVYSVGSISSGTQDTVQLDAWQGSPVSVGSAATGYIWVSYTTSSSSTTQFVQLATVSAKAT